VVKLYKSGQYDLANRHVAAICPGIAQAEELTKAIRKLGVKAECITNKTKDDERERILAAADRGEVKFLASVFALREGWDCKLFEVALMLRPTRSRVLYIQFMGRVLRLLLGKVALVVDPFFLNTKFAPLSAPVLFGLPGQKVTRGDILIGPRGRKPPSPYLVKLIERSTPTLVIEHPDIEYWADESGFFEADGERWGTVVALTRALGVSQLPIKARISTCRNREGKAPGGQPSTFYALSDVRTACADLLEELPQAGADGTFEADGEVWGSVLALSGILNISGPTLTGRLGSCRSRDGKNINGRRFKFYALSDIRTACADLLEDLPQAGTNGTFRAGGMTWGTIKSLARLLALSESTVMRRIASFHGRDGKLAGGQKATFYALSDVRTACADLLKKKKSSTKN
jgi:hypothetical protein